MYRETILSPLVYLKVGIMSTGLSRRGICSPVSSFRPICYLDPIESLFSVAHLGCEIKLRDAPHECYVKGSLITPGTQVVIESAFGNEHPKYLDAPRRVALGYVQRIPVIGRLLAHSTSFYWASLQGVKAGTCAWLYD